jgi:predicted nucleic acid-binding Zn ribbon protein
MRQPENIKDILKKTLLKTTAKQEQYDIQKAWEYVVGKDAARHAQPSNIFKKVLTISVDSPVWIYQLNLKRRYIETALSERIGLKEPIRIRLRAGELEKKLKQKKGRKE